MQECVQEQTFLNNVGNIDLVVASGQDVHRYLNSVTESVDVQVYYAALDAQGQLYLVVDERFDYVRL
jgi:hypothetical protein